MSALTMKTSAHTDNHHALDRSGTHALCRSNLRPYTWKVGQWSSDQQERSAVYVQSGDTFTRSCSRTRVNCLACLRKLKVELANAEEEAHAWQGVLVRMAREPRRPRLSTSARSAAVAIGMRTAGYLEDGPQGYVLTALGRRAAGLESRAAAEEQAHRWNDTLRGLAKAPGMTATIKDTGERAAAEELVSAGYGLLLSGSMPRLTLTHEGIKAAGVHLEWLSGAIGSGGQSALLQWVTRGADATLTSDRHDLARHGLATLSAEGDHVLTGLAYRVAAYLRSADDRAR